MLRSQLFFQLTELFSAYFLYHLLDRQNHRDLPALVPVFGLAVNSAHIIIALKERVLWGLFMPGIHTVNGRDVMLMAGDISCLVFFGRLLHSLRLKPKEQLQLLPWGAAVTVGMVLFYMLLLGYKYQ